MTVLPVLEDNFVYLLRTGDRVAAVDPGEADPVIKLLDEKQLRLDAIFNTHAHADHVAGNAALVARTRCPVHAPAGAGVPGLTDALAEGRPLEWAGWEIEVLHTPGHTAHDLSLHLPAAGLLFTGDILFNAGCGRPLAGDAAVLFASLERLASLPADTRVCCGHEYTLDNLRFARSLLPDDPAFARAEAEARRQREAGRPTVPFRLGDQLQANIFLRASDPAVQRTVGLEGAPPVAVFGELRARKSRFA